MVSMCFQLMQDEMVAKFKWLGQKCGIGKKNEDKGDAAVSAEKEEEPDKDKGNSRPRTAIRSGSSSSSAVKS